MDERRNLTAAEDFTRPWSQRRGIESIDRNAEVVLVRVPLDQLSNILAAQAIESQRDVMGAQIELLGNFVFTYQLVGHSWSIMVPGFNPSVLQSTELARLSNQLGQPVIRLQVSDTGGAVGYDLFENGRLTEYFQGVEENLTHDSNEHGIHPQRYIWFPPPEELEEDVDPNEPARTAYFWSSRRQVTTAEEIGSIWGFAGQLLIEYDTFDPAIDDRYLLGEYSGFKRGSRYRVQNPGFTLVLGYDQDLRRQEVTSVPDLVRVDYFRFGS